jgi:hypothetical protein
MIGDCLLEQVSGRACAEGEFSPFEVRVREVTARPYFPFPEVQDNTQTDPPKKSAARERAPISHL